MKIIARLCCTLTLLLVIPIPSYSLEEIRTITTRPDTSMAYFIKTPKSATKSVMVMFPSGGGNDHFTSKGSGFSFSDDFLMRNMQAFIDRNHAVSVVGLPSDHEVLEDEFRTSAGHYTDIMKLCGKLATDGFTAIYFVAIGSGTLSAEALANRPLPPEVKGVILVSPMELASIDPPLTMDKVKTPVLLLHHERNVCGAFTMSGAVAIRDSLPKTTKTTFVTLSGGKQVNASPDDCSPAHQLPDFDKALVAAIANWIEGKPVPETIKGE